MNIYVLPLVLKLTHVIDGRHLGGTFLSSFFPGVGTKFFKMRFSFCDSKTFSSKKRRKEEVTSEFTFFPPKARHGLLSAQAAATTEQTGRLTQGTFMSPSSGGRKSKIEALVVSVPGWGSGCLTVVLCLNVVKSNHVSCLF